MSGLVSPTSGLPLRQDGPATLTDGSERWPFLDGIAYLRTGRETLVREALEAIDAGHDHRALTLLLADADDWWDGPAPEEADLRRLVRERDMLTLREAMHLLAFGRVGDYFAHRWSDPTFLAGLALLDAHWTEPESAFELACGIGHYVRELASAGVHVTGGDVVFAKLWLARHWVVGPAAELVCFDARSPWPFAGRSFDLCLCQDAFYFLEPKSAIAERLRGLSSGSLAIGHVHNRGAQNHSAGAAITVDELAALFPDAVLYDDAELTRAGREGAVPRSASAAELRHADALALFVGSARPPRPAAGPFGGARAGERVRRNPLYRDMPAGGAEIVWPSERYRAEYEPLSTFPSRSSLPENPAMWSDEQARRREVVSLPARW